MRTCDACGFENAEEDKPCALCGASEVQRSADPQTTLRIPSGATLAGAAPRESDGASKEGELFAGRYRVDAFLGSGGMGQVFRVHDVEEDRELALKVLHPLAGDDADRTERFKREIGVLSKIRHPAVPTIHGWGTNDREMFFVTDLVDGPDLKMEIRRRGPWAPVEAVALVAAVADALAAAHRVGIVHRDVKPNNIMIDRDGTPRLLDFGLARGMGVDITTLTRTGMIVGTPGYMSPEQFDAQTVDERADIYSLGVVLFEMLTGRLPFTGQTPIAVAMKHKTETPPAVRRLRPEVPAWLERVVLRCLEKDPARRFRSAEELASELRRSRSGAAQRARRLLTGDRVLEDEGETTDWALVLASPKEKTGWAEGLCLRFEERYYRLRRIDAPAPGTGWTYRFAAWPEEEVFRRLVDYEQDCAEREAAASQTLSAKLTKWIGGGKA